MSISSISGDDSFQVVECGVEFTDSRKTNPANLHPVGCSTDSESAASNPTLFSRPTSLSQILRREFTNLVFALIPIR